MNTASNTPLVSVIVPMYGVENYIARCAESLFAQTYPSIEFIFVDDGCKDRSVDVLRGILGKQEPALQARVRIISKENGGLPHARKTGLDAATGEYVLHVDSDDWLETTAVEKLVQKAVETEADIVVYDFWKEYPNRSKLDSERDSSAADPDLFRHRLYTYKSYGYVWNKFCRRSLYDGVFVPKYAMHEDIVFSTQILYKARKVVHLKEGLYHYDRTVSASATRAPQIVRRVNSARNLLDLYLHFSISRVRTRRRCPTSGRKSSSAPPGPVSSMTGTCSRNILSWPRPSVTFPSRPAIISARSASRSSNCSS